MECFQYQYNENWGNFNPLIDAKDPLIVANSSDHRRHSTLSVKTTIPRGTWDRGLASAKIIYPASGLVGETGEVVNQVICILEL